MSTIDLNPEGYKNTSVLSFISNYDFTNCKSTPVGFTSEQSVLTLFHGVLDDNVHPDHSMNLIERLQMCGTQFNLMLYPNQDHSIVNRRRFLYSKILLELRRTIFKDISGIL